MSDKNLDRPPVDSPEFDEWLKKRCEKYTNEPIGNTSDFDERDLVSGDINDLRKSDAELFPEELEEYSPEERRKTFKVHKREEKSKKSE